MSTPHPESIAKRFLHSAYNRLSQQEIAVVDAVVHRATISRNVVAEMEDTRSYGERLADRIAAFGGSWPFIILFLVSLVVWVALNTLLLRRRAFDPYPYILLNLFLSMLASLQAPIIMMSQNRQAAKDRLDAAHDFEVNLKAEIEIRQLHDKIDELQHQRWVELMKVQEQQTELLQMLNLRAGGA